MIRWAIRHKPTGRFLPQSSSKRHGYTHDEPAIMEDSNICPRLFGRVQDAKTALTWWLKGETMGKWVGGSYLNVFGEHDDDFDFEWSTQAREDRKAEDMEVVEIMLGVSDVVR